jgi:hypothetical protein
MHAVWDRLVLSGSVSRFGFRYNQDLPMIEWGEGGLFCLVKEYAEDSKEVRPLFSFDEKLIPGV